MIRYIKVSYEGDGVIRAQIHLAYRHVSRQVS